MLAQGMVLDNKYQIISEIGRGGMSIVYCAVVQTTGKLWAIKEARLEDDSSGIKRSCMMKEIEILKLFNYAHVPQNIRSKIPQIADVIDDGQSNLIVIMDYIEGVSLDKILMQNGAVPEKETVSYMQQLCEVLSYLHSNQIIYCDIKPANIMLRENGEIAIVDFGAAKTRDTSVTDTQNLGTKGYAAPEQYKDFAVIDNRSDIYALGMTMYALLTGKNPNTEKITDTSVRKINPACSVTLDKIIQKCVSFRPQDRYQSCEEVLSALKNYQKSDAKIKRKKFFKFIPVVAVPAVLGGGILWLKNMQPAGQPVPATSETVSVQHRYEVIHQSVTWAEAKDYCESLGGHLATITSPEEQQELEELISQLDEKIYFSSAAKDHMFLIGGYKQGDSWHWVTGEEWNYSDWDKTQPIAQEAFDAAAFTPEWVSVNTAYTYTNFICEWD